MRRTKKSRMDHIVKGLVYDVLPTSKRFWNRLFQTLFEWHCIMDGHVWYEYDNKIKCARCRKIRR